jgi:hypothetical protein
MSANPGEVSGLPPIPKRGALPTPRSVLASARPFAPLVGAPPNSIVIPPKISIWGNDVHGDCVTAEEAFAKACSQPEIFISDQEVMGWATRHGVLEGAVVHQVLDWMRTDGFHQDGQIFDDGGSNSVDWTNPEVLKSAISQGPVKIGVAADQLLNVWRQNQGRSGWFASGFNPDHNEDHCVSLCGYGTIAWLAQKLNVAVPAGVDGTKPGYALFTWNSIGIIDVPSMVAITAEAWLRAPTTIINQDSGWHPWFRVSGGAAAPRSPITVVARNPNHLDLFVTGTDGRIYSTWWDANGGWANWFNVSGGAAALGSPITAVARNPNHLDLFVTGTDGRIYSTWWDANGGWANWFNVSGGAAALGSRVEVISRNPNHLDLFVTGTDGRIYSTWWDAMSPAVLQRSARRSLRWRAIQTISTCLLQALMAASTPPGGMPMAVGPIGSMSPAALPRLARRSPLWRAIQTISTCLLRAPMAASTPPGGMLMAAGPIGSMSPAALPRSARASML